MLKKFQLEKSSQLEFSKLCIRIIFIVVGIGLFMTLAIPATGLIGIAMWSIAMISQGAISDPVLYTLGFIAYLILLRVCFIPYSVCVWFQRKQGKKKEH